MQENKNNFENTVNIDGSSNSNQVPCNVDFFNQSKEEEKQINFKCSV